MLPTIEIALITYNSFSCKQGVHRVNGIDVLIASEIFFPKCPENVHIYDPQFQMILSCKLTLKKVIIFLGKKQSGSLKMIDLCCRAFHDQKEILYFVLCHHDIEEKKKTLAQYGIGDNSFICCFDKRVFADSKRRCNEVPWLLSTLLYFVACSKTS